MAGGTKEKHRLADAASPSRFGLLTRKRRRSLIRPKKLVNPDRVAELLKLWLAESEARAQHR
ncbi:hypothetical protein BKM15_16665 [Pseudomonas syringae pv. syringae]|nr:hypothetical protein BKM15_16665 [Pseudomonas syringae pv. syringae]